MSYRNNEQLNQIKMKYGYSSKQSLESSANVKQFISHMQSRPADDPFQKIQIKNNRLDSGQPKQIDCRQSTFRQTKQQYSRYRSTSSKQVPSTRIEDYSSKPNFDYLFAQNYQKTKASLQQKYSKPQPSQPQDKKGLLDSYEKKYDLLRNYRQKIKQNFQAKLEPSRERDLRLNIRENKQNLLSKYDKVPCAESKIYYEGETFNPSNKCAESKFTIDQLKTQKIFCQSRPSSGKVHQPRTSPLQSLDPNIFDVNKKLDNIDKIQGKIRAILGEKGL